MSLIPVELEFMSLAVQCSAYICISTPNVFWALAGEDLDDQGLSYNSTIFNDPRPPCLQQFQLRTSQSGSVLEVEVSPSGAGSSFTLTCYLEAPSDLTLIEGFCSLNEAGYIRARFGDARPVEWRGGAIIAPVYCLPVGAERVIVTCENISALDKIAINLASESAESDVKWLFFSGQRGITSLSITPLFGELVPLCDMSISKSQIVLRASADVNASGGNGFVLTAHFNKAVSVGGKSGEVVISADYGGEGLITARVGNKLPKYLAGSRSALTS